MPAEANYAIEQGARNRLMLRRGEEANFDTIFLYGITEVTEVSP